VAALAGSAPAEATPSASEPPVPSALGFHEAMNAYKRRLLAEAIARHDGNRAAAARELGLQRTYLYRLTKQLGL
jgi:anaerobic nitric oxide reductase transcription regulator